MLVERVSDGYLALDAKWEIEYINPIAEKMMDRSPGYLLGKNIWKEYPELIGKGFYIAYHKSMATQQNLHIVEHLANYEVWVEATIYPSVTGISVFFRDVTEQKKIEQLNIALGKEKEINELKSGFVSMASHEFRTPLSTIRSSAYLIEKYKTAEEQPQREKHLHRINSSVEVLTEILNDFLSLSKIEEGGIQVNLSQFDIAELVSTTIDEIKDNLKKAQEFIYHHSGEPVVTLDKSLFKHIVMNLVSNASKFSPGASRIETNTSCQEGRVTLSVKDQGIGISEDDQKHLMERFFRGANAGNIQGTGLGLHIVSKYAELMKGIVKCSSELNKGTEFSIVLEADVTP